MTSSTYLSQAALDQLDAAQDQLYEHLVTSLDGRCRTCHEIEPCAQRQRLMDLFLRYGQLPRREPGRAGLGMTHRMGW